MGETAEETRKGWEIAHEVESEKPTMFSRARVSAKQMRTLPIYAGIFILLFLGAVYLANNPFDFTQRIPSSFVKARGWVGNNNWTIIWWVVLICVFFEYMDSVGGMGYGTALTPLILVAGFDPIQVVPCIMITEMFTGFTAGLLHGEFENVQWKWRPMNETLKLVVVISVIGMLCVGFSIMATYKIFMVHKFWIKLYVTFLLVVMGVCSLLTTKKFKNYRPKWMWFFAAIAGFNKGIGGGGYGPVVTVGGLISGVPVKSMVAITSFAEGMTCLFAVIVWFSILASGVVVDYVLLPSFVIGTMLTSVAAPLTTRILPEKFWKVVVPLYCCILSGICFWKIWPDILKRLAG